MSQTAPLLPGASFGFHSCPYLTAVSQGAFPLGNENTVIPLGCNGHSGGEEGHEHNRERERRGGEMKIWRVKRELREQLRSRIVSYIMERGKGKKIKTKSKIWREQNITEILLFVASLTLHEREDKKKQKHLHSNTKRHSRDISLFYGPLMFAVRHILHNVLCASGKRQVMIALGDHMFTCQTFLDFFAFNTFLLEGLKEYKEGW